MTAKNNEFSFEYIEDMTDLTSTTELDFGFDIFASYLKLASLFQIIKKSMWIPTDLIYEDINYSNNLNLDLDENTQNEVIYEQVHEYIDAYVKKGIFETSIIDDRFCGKDAVEFECNEMVRMVNPADMEAIMRFAKLISLEQNF